MGTELILYCDMGYGTRYATNDVLSARHGWPGDSLPILAVAFRLIKNIVFQIP